MASGPRITIGSAVSNVALTATNSTTFTYSWSTSGVSAGSYTVTVTGTDLAGNTYAGSDKITITLDSTAPTVTLRDTDDDNLLAASDTVTITALFNEAMTATPTISISGVVSNILMSVASGASSTGSITQIGGNIYGESRDNYFGWSVSIASDLNRVAIGAPRNDDAGSYSGHVRVYQWNGSVWTKLGADIDGEAANDNSGHSVSISSDGSRVAIGAIQNDGNGSESGHVRVYQWDGSDWTKLGADIDGEAVGDRSGSAVSLSSDGSILAVGAHNNGPPGNQSNFGHVRIYRWNGSAWNRLGADIDGDACCSAGKSVSLSSDGFSVAVGSSNYVRVFKFINNSWIKQGSNITGETPGDNFGVSVSLSSDGSRVAIGGYTNGGGGMNSGHVRIYDFNGSSWVQAGADIDGEAAGDQSGYSVSLSSDGSRLAIGAIENDGGGDQSGHVRIYEFKSGSWSQVGADINGGASGDNLGRSVSISSDGSRVAIGGNGNDGNGTNSGVC